MRFRPWLFLAALVLSTTGSVAPASAAGSGFDQMGMIRDVQDGLRTVPRTPTQWLDLGVALPVGTFDDRNWDPGMLIRWSDKVWEEGPFGLVGSLGLMFNDDTRFNEAQVDSSANGGFGSYIPIDQHRHVSVPLAIELHLEPAMQGSWSPFIAVGPAVQWTHEALVREEWVQITSTTENNVFAVPIPTPGQPVPVATEALNKTHFHPGWQARGGLRFKVGTGANPLHMRLTGSGNVWYEHSRPLVVVGGSLSFGR